MSIIFQGLFLIMEPRSEDVSDLFVHLEGFVVSEEGSSFFDTGIKECNDYGRMFKHIDISK